MQTDLVTAGLSKDDAEKLAIDVEKITSSDALSSEKWRQISKQLLTPQQPFPVHEYLFKKVYENSTEPNYIWIPTQQEIEETNLYKYMQSQNKKNILELFDWADANREEFWRSMVETLNIKFHDDDKKDNTVFDLSKGVHSPIYFPNRKMNAADWILTGDDARTVIIWAKEGTVDKEGNPILNKITLAELKQSVTNIAYNLTHKLELKPGDAVGIDMPMNWQSVAIYLGILKAGMIVVSIADSFAPAAIEVRLKISNAKAVFTQDVIARGAKKIGLYERVVKAHCAQCIVMAQRDDNELECELRDCDISWIDFISGDDASFASVSCDSMCYANILFSSGTTGEPKAIPWHHSTFIKPFVDGYLHNDVRDSEVIAWPTNIGWMMGPWLISQIGLNASIALFVGSPVTSGFCKFVECGRISHLGVIPSIVKSWMRFGATAQCNWSCVRRYSSTGEASNPALYHWLCSRSCYSPVLEYVGGTEIAGGYLGGSMVQPQILSAFSMPCFGLNIHLLDDCGDVVSRDVVCGEGEVAISPPSCGLSVTLLNKDHTDVYYGAMPTYKDNILRRHGDQIRIIAHSSQYGTYYQHLGRVDDTMNLGGIKVSSVALENVILQHPLLSREVAAIAFRQTDIDQEQLVICCVPKSNEDLFVMQFDEKPLGIKLAPVKDNDCITVLCDKDNEQPVVYKMNDNVVYNTLSFDKVIECIRNCDINSDNPLRIHFLRQRFNPDCVKKEIQQLLKTELNPLFRVRDLYLIHKLPRTASGKVMRRILRGNYAAARRKQ